MPPSTVMTEKIMQELTGIAVGLGDHFEAAAKNLNYPPEQMEYMRGVAAKERFRKKYKDLGRDALESILPRCTDPVEAEVVKQLKKEAPAIGSTGDSKAQAVVDRIMGGSRVTRASAKTMADCGIVIQVDGEGASLQKEKSKRALLTARVPKRPTTADKQEPVSG